ncbi:MAG TPA: integron integrase [Thermodesulfobacteriaceae bacterium]|nr:integron integrase [Thermodesulfobacteriaceae bacterium]
MLKIPLKTVKQFSCFIVEKGVPANQTGYYLKWLKYYLDFCHKYGFKALDMENRTRFLEKLRAKKQGESLRKQAHHAVSLFYEMTSPCLENSAGIKNRKVTDTGNNVASFFQTETDDSNISSNTPFSQAYAVKSTSNSGNPDHDSESGAKVKITDADWTEVFNELKNAIKIRHYSPRTLKAYSAWARKFQAFTRSKEPSLISTGDVKSFLTWLATDQGISASSQNQAFNALLFLFRNVFNMEFGRVDGIVRAKRRPYIPVVLSRDEVDRIIGFMRYPHSLVCSLLYGCGLRISECLSLRVQNFNFDMGILTIHDGKGRKDRTVPIPDVLVDDLKAHLEKVVSLHEQDRRDGYDGVFLYGLLEKKYKNAARELVLQWFFPAKELTSVPETNELRRYHLHETSMQKAIRRAVKKARISKRVTAHTFRHSFASHLLQANYDIRTIQELLGHSDVRTTMIYTHTVKSRTIKEAKSPLDF